MKPLLVYIFIFLALLTKAQDSIHKEYYPNGNLMSETPVVNNKFNGIRKTYFNVKWAESHELVKSETPFLNGVQNGIETTFTTTKALKSETVWVNGIPVSTKTSFTIGGTLVANHQKVASAQQWHNKNYWHPQAGIKIKLRNRLYVVVDSTQTDDLGNFHFRNVQGGEKYHLVINQPEAEPLSANNSNLAIYDSTGRMVATARYATMTKTWNFRGRRRLSDYSFGAYGIQPDLTCMPEINTANNPITLSGNLLSAEGSKPVSDEVVKLIGANGEVIQTTVTNAFGSFTFTELPPDETYSFQVDANDPKLSKIILTDKSGRLLKTFTADGNGKFQFDMPASDTTTIKQMSVDDSQLKLQLEGNILSDKKTPVAFIKVSIYNNEGHLIGTVTTDSSGKFVFTDLPPDQNYTYSVDANDCKLDKLFLIDHKNEVHEFLLKDGKFKFELLPADKIEMGTLYVDDPWIAALNLKKSSNKTDSLDIFENIYYEYQKWDINPAAARILDKVVAVMGADSKISIQLNAFTDPRGTDEFNLKLSQQRAEAAVKYITSKGISQTRIKGKGCGKAQINNSDKTHQDAGQDLYSADRHTEFKLVRIQ